MNRMIFGIALFLAAGASGSVSTYFGTQIQNVQGIATYDGGVGGGQFYQEGGLDHSIGQSSFSTYGFPNGTSGLYINGGGTTMLTIKRTDGLGFGVLEMETQDGFGSGGQYLWALAYQGGSLQDQWSIDKGGNTVVGFAGSFDELRIAAYNSAGARDNAYNTQDQNAYQAIAIDNTRYGQVPSPGAAALLGVGGLVALRRRR